jgi:hypothetical protein
VWIWEGRKLGEKMFVRQPTRLFFPPKMEIRKMKTADSDYKKSGAEVRIFVALKPSPSQPVYFPRPSWELEK